MRKTLAVLALAAACALVTFRSTYEPDLWWHLAQGRETAAGHLVRTNVFSPVFAGYRQHYTSWLFDLGSYALWTRGGAAAIQIAQAILLTATLWLVAAACRVRASAAVAVGVCALGWIVLEPRAMPRPYLFSFLGMAACAWLIERARAARSARPLLWAPLVVALWANLHVEAIFGVALLTIAAAGELLRPRDLPRAEAIAALGVAALSAIATLLNPYGIGLWRYLYENTFVPQVIDIAELHPPYLPNYRGFFVWAILAAVVLIWQWRRVSLAELIAIVVFGAMSGRYLRLAPLLFLVSAPTVARGLDAVARGERTRRVVGAVMIAAALLLVRVPLVSLVRGLQAGGDALEPSTLYSPKAMQFARDHDLHGPVFTSINLGGYVAWNLYPAARPLLDARLQAVPPEHFRAVAAASADPSAWTALTRDLDWAVLSRSRINPWSGVGRFDPDRWGTAYKDDAIEILVRRDGRYRTLISDF